MENRVYEVEIELQDEPKTPAERFKIVKFYRPGRWSREAILDEHRFLSDLVGAEISAIAPEVHKGESLHSCPKTGIFFSVFPKCGGRSPDELTSDQIPLVARLLARVHGVGRASVASHRLRISPTSYGSDSLELICKSALLPEVVREIYCATVQRFLGIVSPWFEGLEVQRIHGDCHLGNVIFNSSGPALVDFDDMLMGPVVQDLWMLFPVDDQVVLERFINAYESFRPFPREQLRLIEPLRGLRMIHYSAWIAKRWADQTFPQAFPNFGTQQYWMEKVADLNEVIGRLYQHSYD
jgi:Ser/Thr protein kinase RdoA (MazF antagonist)